MSMCSPRYSTHRNCASSADSLRPSVLKMNLKSPSSARVSGIRSPFDHPSPPDSFNARKISLAAIHLPKAAKLAFQCQAGARKCQFYGPFPAFWCMRRNRREACIHTGYRVHPRVGHSESCRIPPYKKYRRCPTFKLRALQ